VEKDVKKRCERGMWRGCERKDVEKRCRRKKM
jgi:hypothetical protein